MDCRKSLILAVSLAFSCTGCLTQQQSTSKESQPSKGFFPLLSKEKTPAKKLPKLETCLGAGECLEGEALNPKLSPLEKEQTLEKARKAYQQALEVEPGNLKATLGLAHVYAHLKDFDRAMSTYEKALKAHPKNGAIWFDLGITHCQHKEFSKGIEAFQKAVELDPENREYAKKLGFCLARAGRVNESIAVLSKLQGEAQARYNVARMLLHLEQPEAARQQLQMAVQRDPMLQPAQQLLADMGQPAETNQRIVTISFQP